jgi:SagB-type dehydrogenase family enzyme
MVLPRPRVEAVEESVSDAVGVRELFRLRPDAQLLTRADGALILRQSRFEVVMDPSSIARRALLLRLTETWLDEEELERLLICSAGEQGLLQGQVLLRRLVAHSWLCRRLQTGKRPLLDIIPHGLGAGSRTSAEASQPGIRYRFSRFATALTGPNGLSLRSPLATVTIELAEPALGWPVALAASTGCDQQDLERTVNLDSAAATGVLDELIRARVLVRPLELKAEQNGPPQVFWEPEELAVHHRSRAGRHVMPVGGTYRFRDRIPPEPLGGGDLDAGGIALPVPDLDGISAAEPSLSAVVAARRTLRDHDESLPITVEELAQFLYRVQRTWDVRDVEGMQVGRRPYPNAGQICELEIYPLVSRCTGLASGLYHYDSLGHALVQVAEQNGHAARVLNFARAAAGASGIPQVLMVVTARVPRLLWKYEGLGYSLMQKDAGVLIELMYLVATAMKLAPCALGSGDSEGFAALSGLDPLAEPSIADFMLGSRVERA